MVITPPVQPVDIAGGQQSWATGAGVPWHEPWQLLDLPPKSLPRRPKMPALLPWQVLPWQLLPVQPEATTVPVQPLGMPVQLEATATVPWQLAGAPWQPDLCPKPDTSPLDVTAIMRTIVYICRPPEIRLSRIRCEKNSKIRPEP